MLVHEYLIAPYAKGSMRGSLPRAYVPTSNKSILEANKCPGKDPRINPFRVWGNEMFKKKHQVRILIRIISKKIRMVASKLFVYALSNTTVSCRMVTTNSAAFSFTAHNELLDNNV